MFGASVGGRGCHTSSGKAQSSLYLKVEGYCCRSSCIGPGDLWYWSRGSMVLAPYWSRGSSGTGSGDLWYWFRGSSGLCSRGSSGTGPWGWSSGTGPGDLVVWYWSMVLVQGIYGTGSGDIVVQFRESIENVPGVVLNLVVLVEVVLVLWAGSNLVVLNLAIVWNWFRWSKLVIISMGSIELVHRGVSSYGFSWDLCRSTAPGDIVVMDVEWTGTVGLWYWSIGSRVDWSRWTNPAGVSIGNVLVQRYWFNGSNKILSRGSSACEDLAWYWSMGSMILGSSDYCQNWYRGLVVLGSDGTGSWWYLSRGSSVTEGSSDFIQRNLVVLWNWSRGDLVVLVQAIWWNWFNVVLVQGSSVPGPEDLVVLIYGNKWYLPRGSSEGLVVQVQRSSGTGPGGGTGLVDLEYHKIPCTNTTRHHVPVPIHPLNQFREIPKTSTTRYPGPEPVDPLYQTTRSLRPIPLDALDQFYWILWPSTNRSPGQYHKIFWIITTRSPGPVPLVPMDQYHWIPRTSPTRFPRPVPLDSLNQYH
ncbi:hypothetical protein DPMN_181590 [Dreissena polymorpha]|uniref:Uncharacterized protein n=1 Tax=Dreissena polymorpha TaxID=45954 RepID=A0A9D4DGI3_DREPO|nr:hypothetical protein DPMN_181590 [Dreissena polymorpha]